jgi:hypothetical protein
MRSGFGPGDLIIPAREFLHSGMNHDSDPREALRLFRILRPLTDASETSRVLRVWCQTIRGISSLKVRPGVRELSRRTSLSRFQPRKPPGTAARPNARGPHGARPRHAGLATQSTDRSARYAPYGMISPAGKVDHGLHGLV